MGAQTVEWALVAPVVIVVLSAVVALVIDLFNAPARFRGQLPLAVSLLGLGAAFTAVVALWGTTRGTFCVPAFAGTSGGVGAGLGSCSYVLDPWVLVVQGLVVVGTAMAMLMANFELDDIPRGEFHFLMLASAAGAMTLAAARDFATLIVALEVLSLPAFVLVGLRRAQVRSSEAAITFFLFSVISVAVMLFGVSLIYGVTGSLFFDQVAAGLANPGSAAPAVTAGVLLTLVGLLFKVSAVPFHFWAPDTYAGAPISVAAYLSVVSKAGGLIGLIVVVTHAFAALGWLWGPVLAVVAASTMTLGNVAALRQTSTVRVLAWSSIAQAGYLLAPIAVIGLAGRDDFGAVRASLAYLCIYAVVNLGAFAVVGALARGGVAPPGGQAAPPAVTVASYRGMVSREPGGSLALAFFLLCLAGLPPGLVGLFAKVGIIQATVGGGSTWLAVFVVVNTAIGLAYYLPWVARMFVGRRLPGVPVDLPWGSSVVIGTCLVGAVIWSVQPGWLLDLLLFATG